MTWRCPACRLTFPTFTRSRPEHRECHLDEFWGPERSILESIRHVVDQVRRRG